MRAVQVSFHSDAQRRDGRTLLREWPALTSVASAVRRAGVDVRVVRLAGSTETVVHDDVEYHFVADTARRRTDVVSRVVSLAPDVVHVNGFVSARGVAQLIRAMPKVPVLVQAHGSAVPSGWRSAAWRWALRDVAGVVLTTLAQGVPWKRAKILRKNLPVFEVLGGSTHFAPGDQAEARRATRMTGDPCLFWSGRLDANKDPFAVLSAFEQAAAQMPNARLYCCYGDAPLLAAVARRVANSPVLHDRVTLLGTLPHEDMELHFRAADFFVQMSHDEGAGFSLLEALACGTTPLVSDIPAHRAIVADAGALVPTGDVGALTNAMVDWSSRGRARQRAAARARFDAALTFDVIAGQLGHAYESVVAGVAHKARNVVLSEAKDLLFDNAV